MVKTQYLVPIIKCPKGNKFYLIHDKIYMHYTPVCTYCIVFTCLKRGPFSSGRGVGTLCPKRPVGGVSPTAGGIVEEATINN